MKEYTITFTADFTLIRMGGELDPESTTPDAIANWLEKIVAADDVKVKNVKVFER